MNLPGAEILVFSQPGPDGYASVRIARRGDVLSPVGLPGLTLSVNHILG